MKKDPPPFILAQPEEKNILDCEPDRAGMIKAGS